MENFKDAPNKNVNSVDDIPLVAIISNARNVSYRLVKCLTKPLPALSKSQYMLSSTKEFIDIIKNKRFLSTYKITSFDVSSLFTMVSLDFTIDPILKQIYGNKKFETKVNRKGMKNLFLLGTKNIHFRNNIY